MCDPIPISYATQYQFHVLSDMNAMCDPIPMPYEIQYQCDVRSDINVICDPIPMPDPIPMSCVIQYQYHICDPISISCEFQHQCHIRPNINVMCDPIPKPYMRSNINPMCDPIPTKCHVRSNTNIIRDAISITGISNAPTNRKIPLSDPNSSTSSGTLSSLTSLGLFRYRSSQHYFLISYSGHVSQFIIFIHLRSYGPTVIVFSLLVNECHNLRLI